MYKGHSSIFITLLSSHVKWVPCSMAHPCGADGGDGLLIWSAVATILYKKPRTADKGWPSSLGVGLGANNF
jgi:hypothetical protein